MTKIIKVSDETHYNLKMVIVSKHLQTFNEAIDYLIKNCDHQEKEPVAISSAGGEHD